MEIKTLTYRHPDLPEVKLAFYRSKYRKNDRHALGTVVAESNDYFDEGEDYGVVSQNCHNSMVLYDEEIFINDSKYPGFSRLLVDNGLATYTCNTGFDGPYICPGILLTDKFEEYVISED
jgi:hypothetical protein